MASTHDKRRLIALVLGVFLIAALLAACGGDTGNDGEAETAATQATEATATGEAAQPAEQEGGAPEPGVLRIAEQEPPDPFDPATLSDNRSIELAQNVFDGLTRINESDLSVEGAIAEDWSVSADGLTYRSRCVTASPSRTATR